MSRQNTNEAKLNQLKETIGRLESVLIAFSGGVDSSLLLHIAKEVLGKNVVAATAVSDLCLSHEIREAEKTARKLSVRHEKVAFPVLSDSDFYTNSPERCYICKRTMFGKFRALARQEGLRYVADGTNLDDLKEFRPGIKALEELGIVSPLREALFTKADIRAVSRKLGLATWNKPAMACLASRFPYGTRITAPNLEKVRQAEKFLRSLGFGQFRVRHHDDTARIELHPQEMEQIFSGDTRSNVVEYLKHLGYRYIVLDLEGYRTGSLNKTQQIPDDTENDIPQ